MNKIAELRTKSGYTQEKFAKQIGVARSTLAMYETNKSEPDFKTLKTIADIFKVSTDYLLGRIDEENKIMPFHETAEWSNEDYLNGVTETKKVSITADDEEILDKFHAIQQRFGDKGKTLISEFCDLLLNSDKNKL